MATLSFRSSPLTYKFSRMATPLPTAVELNPPFQNDAARAYFEMLEGMYVGLSNGLVVGPTDSDDRT